MFKLQKLNIMIGVFVLFSLLLTPLYVFSQQITQVKVFHTHQDAASLLTTINPLYGDMAKLTARGNRLIVKSSPDVINEIGHLLDEIDTIQKRG
jgi:hypothetical protein